MSMNDYKSELCQRYIIEDCISWENNKMYDDYMIPNEDNRWKKFGDQSWETRKARQQEKFSLFGKKTTQTNNTSSGKGLLGFVQNNTNRSQEQTNNINNLTKIVEEKRTEDEQNTRNFVENVKRMTEEEELKQREEDRRQEELLIRIKKEQEERVAREQEAARRSQEQKQQQQRSFFNRLFKRERYNLPSYGMESYMIKEAASVYEGTTHNETQNTNNNTNINQRNSSTTNLQNINDVYNEINSSYETAINIICKTVEEESKKVDIDNTQDITQSNSITGKKFFVQGENNTLAITQENKLEAKSFVNYMAKAITDITDKKVNKAMVADFLGVTNKSDNSNAAENSSTQSGSADVTNKNKQDAKSSIEKYYIKECGDGVLGFLGLTPLASNDVTNIVQNINNNTNINQVTETVRNEMQLNKNTNIQNFKNRMTQNTEDIQEMRTNLEQNLTNALSANQSNVFNYEEVGIGGKNNTVTVEQRNAIVTEILTTFDETVNKIKKLEKTAESSQNNTQNVSSDSKGSNSVKDTTDLSTSATTSNDNDQAATASTTESSMMKNIMYIVIAVVAIGALVTIFKLILGGGSSNDDVVEEEVVYDQQPVEAYEE